MEESKKPKQSFTLWFTGLPSSGKSTLADAVAKKLRERGVLLERLDGDSFRQTFSKDLGFIPKDIHKNDERAAFVTQLLTQKGVAVLASFVSPYRQDRERAKKKLDNFIEVYVKCPMSECIKRDPKGNYKKALAGKIQNFIGLEIPYQEPVNPDIIVQTHKENVNQCAGKIIAALEEGGYLD